MRLVGSRTSFISCRSWLARCPHRAMHIVSQMNKSISKVPRLDISTRDVESFFNNAQAPYVYHTTSKTCSRAVGTFPSCRELRRFRRVSRIWVSFAFSDVQTGFRWLTGLLDWQRLNGIRFNWVYLRRFLQPKPNLRQSYERESTLSRFWRHLALVIAKSNYPCCQTAIRAIGRILRRRLQREVDGYYSSHNSSVATGPGRAPNWPARLLCVVLLVIIRPSW